MTFRNIQQTRAEYVANLWPSIEEGFATPGEAAAAATDLLMVREALEAADASCAGSLAM